MVRSRSIIATPPGATIKEQLNDRGMSQKEFAVRIDMSEKHVSKLINGEVQLTPEVAVRLEIVLGVPARFWNNLEAIYREKLIKIAAEKAMDADENLARQFPYSEMAKLGWIPQTRNSKEKVINLRKYFEVVSLSASLPLAVNPTTILFPSINVAPCKNEPFKCGKNTNATPFSASNDLSLKQKSFGFFKVIFLISGITLIRPLILIGFVSMPRA